MAVSQESSCAFYASDYHLEMIILPYINENLKENKNVYVFTQNNLEDTINTLVGKVNFENEIKHNILNINWKNEDENKYNELIKDNKDMMIFVKGNEEYIEKVNNNLKQIKEYKNVEIVDCYNIEEVGNMAKSIAEKYKNVISSNFIK